MLFPLIVCAATGASVFLSVLLFPTVKLSIRGKKIKLGTYWVISLIGALILLVGGALPLGELFDGLTADTSVNPLKILILFFSMTALSVYLDEIGFFRYLANLTLARAGKKQTGLFVTLYAVVSLLTVFTSNDIIILTFTPFICFFAKNAKINPLPYLFAEFVAANTWSILLIIGNPTNIYLASSAGIDFMEYATKMLLPTLFAGITSFVMLLFIFNRVLGRELEVSIEAEHIEDKPALVLGISHLGVCTLLLAVSSYLGFEMHLIALGFALSLFLTVSVKAAITKKGGRALLSTLRRLPYELIPFVLSMFVLVLTLNYSGASKYISEFLFRGNTVFSVGISSFLVSNIINNIPMSVLFSSLIEAAPLSAAERMPAVYAAVVGSNIGAFFTPVGALAGIMWASILKRLGVKLSFKRFIIYGAEIAIPTLLLALLGVLIVFGT